jgi:RNA polymerase sigma-54 factor
MFQTPFHAQTQRPTTTAHLAQTMSLLSLTLDELNQQVEKELASNPALELIEERRCPMCHRLLPEHGKCPVCSQPKDLTTEEPVVFISPREDLFSREYNPDAESMDEPNSVEVEELPAYVLRQIASDLAPENRQIAAYMLTHLNEDGLLDCNLVEVAAYFHVLISKIQEIQALIQHADPIGVGSINSSEALLVQLEVLEETNPIPEIAKILVKEHLEQLSRHQFAEIAKKVNVSVKEIERVNHFIGENLNPFPGRSHWGDSRLPDKGDLDVYRHPDIIISTLERENHQVLSIELLMPTCGTLRVNPVYREAIHETKDETKVEMKNDLEKASLFVKCIQQRNNTMRQLMSKIASMQKDFILHGERQLKPVTRAKFAREMGVHESTISRAVANKSVQLPNRRIIPLSMFFDRSLNVRTVLKDIIDNEKHALSDFELVDLLKSQGFAVARRTVAKYRSMEGILPAHLRQVTP